MATMTRTVEAEWLDTLPEHDTRALRSRRDLVRVNTIMGNARIVARLLRPLPRPGPVRIAEIGAGDGAFAARVVKRLGGRGEIVLVDRGARPSSAATREIESRGWKVTSERADVFEWLASSPPLDAIYANLFLHHFDDAAMRRMAAGLAARAPLFVACEPRRSRLALAGARLLGLVGCNDVTRHDAAVSVRAGFSGEEITALWPATPDARLLERRFALFSHGFRAQRA